MSLGPSRYNGSLCHFFFDVIGSTRSTSISLTHPMSVGFVSSKLSPHQLQPHFSTVVAELIWTFVRYIGVEVTKQTTHQVLSGDEADVSAHIL